MVSWRFHENDTEESLTLFEGGECRYLYEDDMGPISQTGTWRNDGTGHAVVQCKEEINGRFPLNAPAIRTVRGTAVRLLWTKACSVEVAGGGGWVHSSTLMAAFAYHC